MIPNGSEGRTIRVREILDDPDPSSILTISENAMTELTQEQRHELALEKYVLDVPDLKEEIKDLSPDDQKDQIQWAFEDEAEAQGLQPWELTLKYTSTPEEFEAQRLVLHKEAAEVLGVEWDEYCEMNNLVV
ncbi:hypothetical protein GCM10009103_13420 [Pseudomonas koreensis]|jgi:hypothetical protein|nr:hypothetical protein GCM10009103_13420 [Pseudomonas koreensis]